MRSGAVPWLIVVSLTHFVKATITPAPSSSLSVTSGGIVLAAWVVEMLALAACAVNIHRHILLNHDPSIRPPTRTDWRYVLRTLRIWLPAIAIVFVGSLLIALCSRIGFGSWTQYLPVITGAAIVIAGAVFVTPRMLSLPAVAIGRADFTVSDSVTASSGNLLRLIVSLFIVPAICVQAISAALQGAVGLAGLAGEPLRILLGGLVGGLTSTLGAVLFAGTLSAAYAGLVLDDREFVS